MILINNSQKNDLEPPLAKRMTWNNNLQKKMLSYQVRQLANLKNTMWNNNLQTKWSKKTICKEWSWTTLCHHIAKWRHILLLMMFFSGVHLSWMQRAISKKAKKTSLCWEIVWGACWIYGGTSKNPGLLKFEVLKNQAVTLKCNCWVLLCFLSTWTIIGPVVQLVCIA